jgi:hypothetical protein
MTFRGGMDMMKMRKGQKALAGMGVLLQQG